MAYGPILNPQPVTDNDPELGLNWGTTALRDRLTAQRYTVLADSIADGLAPFWTIATGTGGTVFVTGGEGLIQSMATANGSAQMVSTAPAYFPGQVAWMNSAARFGDTGVIGNTRRIGVFTVLSGVPQDGCYFELSGSTLNAVTVKGGVATATTSGSWTKFSTAPFTLDTNYHSFEIRWTSNRADFYIDNALRHVATGGATTLTNTLNFPMTIQSINTTASTNEIIAVRNIGIGRFGTPDVQPVSFAGVQTVAIAGQVTPADSVTTLANQSLSEQLAQNNGAARATVHLLGQILAVLRGQVDTALGDEADTLIGEYLNPASRFTNLTN